MIEIARRGVCLVLSAPSGAGLRMIRAHTLAEAVDHLITAPSDGRRHAG